MSCDAKVWVNERGWWYGLHDGPCVPPQTEEAHQRGTLSLRELLNDMAVCEPELYWEIRTYKGGETGLVAYTYPRYA